MGKRTKRNLKVCTVECQWEDCRWVANIAPNEYQVFSDHIKVHADEFVSRLRTDGDPQEDKPVGCCCMWRSCAWEGCGDFMDLLRHVMYHGYHALLKALGKLVQTNLQLATCRIEMEDPYSMLLNSTMFTCQWNGCLTEYACPNKFYRHVENHVMESIVIDENKANTKVQCSWETCDNVFRNKYKLKEHVRVHTHEKLIACPDCGGMFANQTKLLDHLSRQNPEAYESFQCSHCLKRCASERLLRDHMRHHVNYLKCPHCDMTCPNPGSLKYHITYRHTDERPFSCAMCEHSFKSHSDLVRHEESHLEKSYMCDMEGCAYTTKTQHCLRRHIRIMHSNTEKRYICHICNSEYSRGFGLTKHLKKKHNFSWPSGHPRFRYIQYEDGFYRLQMVRFESVELTKRLQQNNEDEDDNAEYDGDEYEIDNVQEAIQYPAQDGDTAYDGDNNVDGQVDITAARNHNTIYFDANNMETEELLYTSVACQTKCKNEIEPSNVTSAPDYVFASGPRFVKEEESCGERTADHPQFLSTIDSGVLESLRTMNDIAMPVSIPTNEKSCPDIREINTRLNYSGNYLGSSDSTGELILQPKPIGYDKSVMAQLVALSRKQNCPSADEAVGSSIVNDLYERLRSCVPNSKVNDVEIEEMISNTTADESVSELLENQVQNCLKIKRLTSDDELERNIGNIDSSVGIENMQLLNEQRCVRVIDHPSGTYQDSDEKLKVASFYSNNDVTSTICQNMLTMQNKEEPPVVSTTNGSFQMYDDHLQGQIKFTTASNDKTKDIVTSHILLSLNNDTM